MANTWLLSLRVASMSAGVLSTALILKLSLPVLAEFVNGEIPFLWSIIVAWLRPPYLYLVLNSIILTLVASSKLQPRNSDADGFEIAPAPVPIKAQEDAILADSEPIRPVFDRIDSDPVEIASPVVFGYVDDVAPEEKPAEAVEFVIENESDEFELYRSNWRSPQMRDPTELCNSVSAEKPLLSQRFSDRKPSKANPEGGKALLGVTKPEREDTLESTWRMITEGRPRPLTRHLKKSETVDTQDSASTSPAHVMKTAETFNDHTETSNSSAPGGGGSGRLGREPSLSQDELNRRVEAFIRKFNDEMRLQRQQSLKQYRDVVHPSKALVYQQ